MVGWGGAAYKPDWVELDVFLRSSRTLESSGIWASLSICGVPARWGQTYLYFEAVEEIDSGCKLKPHENPRYELGAYGRDSRYL